MASLRAIQGFSWLFAQLTVLSLLTVIAAIAPVPAIAADRRVALVVGVAAYRKAPPLRNTLNDARGMVAALRRLNFDVDEVLDPDRSTLEGAVRRFGAHSQNADIAVFFYAGHALEAGGRNWLLPVTVDVHSERDLRFEATDLDSVLEQLQGAARASVILLDACRDNPFRLRLGSGGSGRGLDAGGLARVQAAAGILVAFSTAPGTVAADGTGPNSPFTTALLNRIERPGLEIRQMMAEVRHDVREATGGRQVPWEESAMEGGLYLKAAAPVPVTASGPAPTAQSPMDADALFWDSIRNRSDPAELRAYLNRFPSGIFAELARTRLVGLTPAEPPTSISARLVAGMALVSPGERESTLLGYMAAPTSKAIALSADLKKTWRVLDWPTPVIAEEKALEGCQVASGAPCVLLARNDEVFAPPATGSWPRHDMPRVRYAGSYDPAQIPALSEARRSNPAILNYATAPAPRAMAYHPWGRVFAVTGALSEMAAEEQALAACNADPGRHGDGPCFVYARGLQVVLPERRTSARQ